MIAGVFAQSFGCAWSDNQTDVSALALNARPNGVAVNADERAVDLTDDATSSVLRSLDGLTFAHYAPIPHVAGQGINLSQLTFDDQRNLLVERFGFGSASAVFSVSGPEGVAALTGPDPTRRRLGIAAAGSHQALFDVVREDQRRAGDGG